MRFRRHRRLLAVVALVALAGCSRHSDSSAATADPDLIADQLEAKAANYAMLADNSTNSEAAVALENASDALDESSANVRAAANPDDAVQ